MTTLTILNVFYVLIAIAMIGFILVQRGAGAQAGSGFGAGASATVFGARGAGNFLSKTTKYLAATFFLFSLGMGMYVTRGGFAVGGASDELGVMGGSAPAAAPAVSPTPAATATPVTTDVPAPAPAAAAPATDVPAAPAASASPAPAPVASPAATPDTKQ